jgi:hypothetical protein
LSAPGPAMLTGGDIIVTDKSFAGHEFHASQQLASR